MKEKESVKHIAERIYGISSIHQHEKPYDFDKDVTDVLNKIKEFENKHPEKKIKDDIKEDLIDIGHIRLPNIGEDITVGIIGKPFEKENINFNELCVPVVLIGQKKIGFIPLRQTIINGMFKEIYGESVNFRKHSPTEFDNNILERIFTITGKLWRDAPSKYWRINSVTNRLEPPKIYSVLLRRDIETDVNNMNF